MSSINALYPLGYRVFLDKSLRDTKGGNIMDEAEQKPQPTQICSIRIGFPVTSDEQAIEYKKQIGKVLADIPNARIEFSLVAIPAGLPDGPQIR